MCEFKQFYFEVNKKSIARTEKPFYELLNFVVCVQNRNKMKRKFEQNEHTKKKTNKRGEQKI